MGAAYVYRWNGTSWLERQELTASDRAIGDYFGCSVSISGDTLIVGAYGADSTMGAAYIYKWNGSNWLERQELMASDRAIADQFGISVSISSGSLIAGANGANGSKGAAYIYQWNGLSWLERRELTSADRVVADAFGSSVSISGDIAIAGMYGDDSFKGSACVFKEGGLNWIEERRLLATDGIAGDYFGFSVSNSGDTSLIGAYRENGNKGAAYIFRSCPSADLNGDCKVDFTDLATFAGWWMYGTD